jgi:hypothetical protein
LTLGFGKNNAGAASTFIIGDGTGAVDITGSFNGAKFPGYGGKFPCYDTSGKKQKCPGKGFLYTEVINYGKTSVAFTSTPAVTITDTKAFPGAKQCELDLLLFGSNGKPAGWQLLPIYGKPTTGKVTIPSFPVGFTFPGQSIAVFGFTCA